MHLTLLTGLLALGSTTLAAPLTSISTAKRSNAFVNSPSCPDPTGSLGTQYILVPTQDLGCQKLGGFCKRSFGEDPMEMFDWNVTAADPSPEWVAGANVTERDLEVRDQLGGIYICTQKQWAHCVYNIIPTLLMGQCQNFCNGWATKIASIGPDVGMTCRIFDSPNCENEHWDLVKPGNGDIMDSLHTTPMSMVCKLDT